MDKLLLEAEKFIEKWSKNTMDLFTSKVKTGKPIDHLCIASLTVSTTYARAIIFLLSNDMRMPAKALLRVLFELGAKLAWCLRCPDESPDPDKVVEEKIRRWSKSSVDEKVKILNDFEVFWPEDAISELKTRRKDFETLLEGLDDVKKLPTFKQMVGQLPIKDVLELYVRCYSKFNDAVHLDVCSLGNRVKENGTTLSVGFDSEEPVEDLIHHCVLMERMIFCLVRLNYKWDTKQLMENEI